MTHPRQEILEVLEKLIALSPGLRFGQLVVNLSYLAKGPAQNSLWDVEDAEFLAAAQKLLRTRSQAHGPPAHGEPPVNGHANVHAGGNLNGHSNQAV